MLQSREVGYRGQAPARSSPTRSRPRAGRRARASRLRGAPPRLVLRADHPELYTPEKVNPAFPSVSGQGDPDGALAAAAASIDATYSTPAFHNNPMEPHATVAVWEPAG